MSNFMLRIELMRFTVFLIGSYESPGSDLQHGSKFGPIFFNQRGIGMEKIYRATEKEKDLWERTTRWVLSNEEIISWAILSVVVGWFVIRAIIG